MTKLSLVDLLETENISIKNTPLSLSLSLSLSHSLSLSLSLHMKKQKDVLFNRLRFSTKESFRTIKTYEVLNEF